MTGWYWPRVPVITTHEVAYFRADNKYTLVVTADTETLIRKTIKELANELDPNSFWQIHRSMLVNVSAIAGVHRDFRWRLHVRLKNRKETLAVSARMVVRIPPEKLSSVVHPFRQQTSPEGTGCQHTSR